MENQDDGNSENKNICIPSIKSDVYEASCGSLPEIQTVSKSNTLNRAIIELGNKCKLNEFNINGKCKFLANNSRSLDRNISRHFVDKKTKFCLQNENNCYKFDKQIKIEKSKCMRECNDESLEKLMLSDAQGETVDDTELREWDSVSISDRMRKHRRKVYKSVNNSIRIKLSFNPNHLPNHKKSRGSPENCALEIELNGKSNSLKITNNKTTQINSQAKLCEDRMKNTNQIMNFKKVQLVNTYTSLINNSRMNYQDTSISTKPSLLPIVETSECNNVASQMKVDNPSLVTSSSSSNARINPNTTCQNDPFKSFSESKSLSISTSNGIPLEKIEKNKSNSGNDKRDESVQTVVKKSVQSTNINEDQDMVKLGVWLDILNNSEYNLYNQDLGLPLQNDKLKSVEARKIKNERNFQSFLEELGHDNSLSYNNIDKKVNHFKKDYSKQNNSSHSICSRQKHTLEEKKSHQTSLQENTKVTDSTSLQSIDLNEVTDDYYKFSYETKNSENPQHNNLQNNKGYFHKTESINGLSNNTSTDNSFRKFVQSVITRLVPRTNNKWKRTADKSQKDGPCSIYTLSEKNSDTLWTKINPFKYCFFKSRRKRFSKVSEDRRKFLNNMYNSTSTTVQYCCLPSNNCTNCTDFNDYRSQADTIKSFCNSNSYFNEGYPYYPSNIPCNYSAINYPYDTIPFMQCPGGCSLCKPESNHSQTNKPNY